jgi:hypothetical protein
MSSFEPTSALAVAQRVAQTGSLTCRFEFADLPYEAICPEDRQKTKSILLPYPISV